MSGNIRVRDQHQKEFVRLVDGISGRFSRWTVWSDFITMAAISLSNTVDKANAPDRELSYKRIAEKYNADELQAFSQMFAEIVMGLEENPDQDFLGELYMTLELGNDHAGQFFTPYCVCKMMSKMNVESARENVEQKGWFSVNDCACGAGALLVAFANVCREIGINYQSSVLFVAQDIDYIVGMMCYIQLSLLGCAGYVVIDNSISKPVRFHDRRGLIPVHGTNIWYTPFFFRQEWDIRRTAARIEMLFPPAAEKRKAAASEPEHAAPMPEPKKKAKKKEAKPPAPVAEYHETKYGQLSLF